MIKLKCLVQNHQDEEIQFINWFPNATDDNKLFCKKCVINKQNNPVDLVLCEEFEKEIEEYQQLNIDTFSDLHIQFKSKFENLLQTLQNIQKQMNSIFETLLNKLNNSVKLLNDYKQIRISQLESQCQNITNQKLQNLIKIIHKSWRLDFMNNYSHYKDLKQYILKNSDLNSYNEQFKGLTDNFKLLLNAFTNAKNLQFVKLKQKQNLLSSTVSFFSYKQWENSMAFDNKLIFLGNQDSLRCCEITSDNTINQLYNLNVKGINKLVYSQIQKLLICGLNNGEIKTFDEFGNQYWGCLQVIKIGKNILDIIINENEDQLIVGNDQNIQILKIDQCNKLWTLQQVINQGSLYLTSQHFTTMFASSQSNQISLYTKEQDSTEWQLKSVYTNNSESVFKRICLIENKLLFIQLPQKAKCIILECDKDFKLFQTIPLNEEDKNDFTLNPIIYNKKQNILMLYHGNNIYIMKKSKIILGGFYMLQKIPGKCTAIGFNLYDGNLIVSKGYLEIYNQI